ncbi:hypothetical protein ACE6H2_007118 [Prunus campanulata]
MDVDNLEGSGPIATFEYLKANHDNPRNQLRWMDVDNLEGSGPVATFEYLKANHDNPRNQVLPLRGNLISTGALDSQGSNTGQIMPI